MPRSLPKPYAVLERGRTRLRFYHGDAVETLNRLPAGSIDAFVTSPPYNLGIQYRSYDDGLPQSEYLDWTGEWIKAATRVLSDKGSLFLNVGAKPKDPWTALDVAQAARRHLQLQNIIHWVKSIAIEKALAGSRAGLKDDLAVGHYKPINSQRFLNDCHEFVFHFSKAGDTPIDRQAVGVKYQDKSNITRWEKAGSGLRCRGNTWFLPYDTIQSRDKERPHPATFPWRLPAYCLRLHGTGRVKVAADPFLGLGSSAVACATLGISFVGIELDAHYLKEAVARAKSALNEAPPRPKRAL
ncbi:MAG TPA: site-specific DNA-methyltransferase [Vicinamibacterales bacterium]|nr:site-specific DNA-methyltransferase [Vicinamibacterales bacterium]